MCASTALSFNQSDLQDANAMRDASLAQKSHQAHHLAPVEACSGCQGTGREPQGYRYRPGSWLKAELRSHFDPHCPEDLKRDTNRQRCTQLFASLSLSVSRVIHHLKRHPNAHGKQGRITLEAVKERMLETVSRRTMHAHLKLLEDVGILERVTVGPVTYVDVLCWADLAAYRNLISQRRKDAERQRRHRAKVCEARTPPPAKTPQNTPSEPLCEMSRLDTLPCASHAPPPAAPELKSQAPKATAPTDEAAKDEPQDEAASSKKMLINSPPEAEPQGIGKGPDAPPPVDRSEGKAAYAARANVEKVLGKQGQAAADAWLRAKPQNLEPSTPDEGACESRPPTVKPRPKQPAVSYRYVHDINRRHGLKLVWRYFADLGVSHEDFIDACAQILIHRKRKGQKNREAQIMKVATFRHRKRLGRTKGARNGSY